VDSLQGKLLISEPPLADPFFRTVVLMINHDENGALGLILNRPTSTKLATVWKKLSKVKCGRPDVLHFGGPCEGPLMVLHRDPQLSEVQAMTGLFFSTDRDAIERIIGQPDVSARFYIGYSGWGPGQLESELARGAWLISPASVEHIFADVDNLWSMVRSDLGDRAVFSALPLKHIPPQPWMN
jgi:putative transcriptional regulator